MRLVDDSGFDVLCELFELWGFFIPGSVGAAWASSAEDLEIIA